MRKVLAVIAFAGLLTSCSSSGSDGAASTSDSVAESSAPTSTSPEVGTATTAPGELTASTPPPLTPVSLPADCPEPTATTVPPVLPDPVTKPEIELPDPLPSELEIIDLVEGTGPAAEAGDQVAVYYVGVRSNDGVEFDSNFGSGTPFGVTLGGGGVIEGWQQGLVGVQAGTRRQLNIPPALGYGQQDKGEAIPPNTPLTFIVDVVAIRPGPPAVDPADEPTFEFPIVTMPVEFTTDTLVEGDRCDIAQIGSTIFVSLKLVRGDTGEVIDDTWLGGSSVPLALDESTVWGLAQGIAGMGLGEQRLITIPPDSGLGAEGNQANGLNPDTVVLAYVEFVGRP